MSSAIKKIATATAVTLVAGLGLTGSAGGATAAAGGFCEGQSAPANTNTLNQAPVLTNDTVNMTAGTLATVKVLANDTDPDGDRLYLENATSPRRGEVCINSTGTIDILADVSRSSYTTTFTYGVTDGDRYRTATVTVNALGLKPMRPALKQRLITKKHSKRVKQRAVVSVTNAKSNKYRMLLLAGNPKKDEPTVQHYVYPGRTFVFSTKEKKLAFLTVLAPKSDDFITFVNQGLLNTKNGRLSAQFIGETATFDRQKHVQSSRQLWARR